MAPKGTVLRCRDAELEFWPVPQGSPSLLDSHTYGSWKNLRAHLSLPPASFRVRSGELCWPEPWAFTVSSVTAEDHVPSPCFSLPRPTTLPGRWLVCNMGHQRSLCACPSSLVAAPVSCPWWMERRFGGISGAPFVQRALGGPS